MQTRDFVVTETRFTASTPADRETGLFGYVVVTLNGHLQIDGIALRRTLDGRMTISWPDRRTASGRPGVSVRPLDRETQEDLERQVLSALGFGEADRE